MGLKLEEFKEAFEAMPEQANGEDVSDFLGMVAVAYLPPREAIVALLKAVTTVISIAEQREHDCICEACTAEKTKH